MKQTIDDDDEKWAKMTAAARVDLKRHILCVRKNETSGTKIETFSFVFFFLMLNIVK